MQEATDSQPKSGESCSPIPPVGSGRAVDGPGLSSGKPKKRERPDQSTTPGKKVQLVNESSGLQKRECTEDLVGDGGLASTAAVEQLLSSMKQGKLSSLQRSTVAKILVATSVGDFLKKFVFLGGVSILEEWVQEGARISSTEAMMTDSNRALDEEIMDILQALEKLPISLETLKCCGIGKSVKQLRSVRNGEIQKRAKKLVDTWRKRVDLEIKQSCTQPLVVNDRLQQVDTISYASDHSPGKMTEVSNGVAAKSWAIQLQEGDTLVKPQVLLSIVCNGAPLDGLPGLNSSKKQKLSLPLCTEDLKDEGYSPDHQIFKEKGLKVPTGGNHAITDLVAKKTNEYRKKLRSGASTAPPGRRDSNPIALPGSAVQSRDNKAENFSSIDRNVGDSEQQQHTDLYSHCPVIESAHARNADGASDPPARSDKDAGNEDGTVPCFHMQGGKVEDVNESCLSSQSSCSNKGDIGGANGLIGEKMNLLTSPFQGVDKLHPVASRLSEQANDSSNGQGVVQGSSRSLSSENNHPDVIAHKLTPKAESNPLSESVVNVFSGRNGSANVTHGEIGAADGEESCCSHNTQMYKMLSAVAVTVLDRDENVEQITAEHSPTHCSVHKVVDTLGGAECTKFISNTCQELSNEAVNATKGHSSVTNGYKSSNGAGEIEKTHTGLAETPAVTQSCHDFDLNEGLAMEEYGHEIQAFCYPPSSMSAVVPKVTGTLSAPIAVNAATKGAFIPSLDALSKADVGWRGSAATSAFRPAEPRHASAKMQLSTALATTEARTVGNFDLNVADHGSVEDSQFSSCQGLQEAHVDQNYGGNVNQKLPSILDSSKQPHVGSLENCGEKRAVLDFDLNEQLIEVPQEQVNLTTSAKTYDDCNAYVGLTGNITYSDQTIWKPANCAFYLGSAAAVGPRIELFRPDTANQAVASSRKATSTTLIPQPSTSVVFSQAAPFFGGGSQQMSFPASFTYNPVSVGHDMSFMVSKGMPATIDSPWGVQSRTEMSVRPALAANIDDVREGNNILTWGRASQNTYGNSGATIFSYNDAAVRGNEHVVNIDGNASLEAQMRLFQPAVVPVSSFKRRDPDYFPGLKQSWH